MDIIAFGTGQASVKMLPLIEKSHRILFVTDNDEKKWGTGFGKYIVKSPKEILGNDCGIVIMTTRYAVEVSQQLLNMGISEERVFFCREYQRGRSCDCDIYPLKEDVGTV